MRKKSVYGGTGSAVLDAPEAAPSRPYAASEFRRVPSEPLRTHRELVDDYADDADTAAFLRASGRNRRVRRGLIPKTRNGWIAAGVGTLAVVLGVCAGAVATMRYVSSSDKFRIPSSQNIEIDGNSHLTRAQMLSVFGGDIDRNLFTVPLEERRADLEKMPWVEHATVMRLMPNRIRVHVTERTPVAFVRQGGNIGMVDASGVLLDIPPDAPGNPNYSFPVVTGLKAEDEPEARLERMKLYTAFMKDLDSEGKGITQQLSEVDLSDSEDVKALIPDHNTEVLVHFGNQGFLPRYKKFEEHIAEWRQQYARLSGVDMRYERQVVLQMPPKDSTVADGAAAQPGSVKAPPASAVAAAPRLEAPQAIAPKTIASKSVAPKTIAPQAKAVAAAPRVVATAQPKPASPPAARNVTKPATVARPVVVAKHVEPARPVKTASKGLSAKDAATQKRVEAIRAWMAKREKARTQQGPAAKVS